MPKHEDSMHLYAMRMPTELFGRLRKELARLNALRTRPLSLSALIRMTVTFGLDNIDAAAAPRAGISGLRLPADIKVSESRETADASLVDAALARLQALLVSNMQRTNRSVNEVTSLIFGERELTRSQVENTRNAERKAFKIMFTTGHFPEGDLRSSVLQRFQDWISQEEDLKFLSSSECPSKIMLSPGSQL